MGKEYMGTNRVTYLIDEQGAIEKVWPKVKPETHAMEVLEWLQRQT
jgi:peroxiredoxin Q/BCP